MNNDPNRSDLAALKRDLERVEMDLRFLRVKAEQIETRITAAERAAEPPIILGEPALELVPVSEPEAALPPIIQEWVTPTAEPVAEPVFQEVVTAEPQLASDPEPVVAMAKAADETPASFEIRLGTFWFVRIGIVMVLTAMVFLGNYAYQHMIGLLGPLGKVSLLYVASFGLLGLGSWLPRRQERLKNYGQVLYAGGLAAVYFTTYAAHHFPNLRVITSAALDGILLLAWTAFIVWRADRKKSEVLAVFAIGLAYYTALITNVGSFTLVSNLLLAVAAVFFLIRNRWVNLSFLSLIASYGAYFYWRYYAGSTGIQDTAARFALGGYWVIFTAAVFLTRHEDFVGSRRASFLSFNNGAAFALLTFSFFHEHSGNFWMLAMGTGVLLLGLAALAKAMFKDDELATRAYLAQGLLLVTLGLITKLTGPTLALVLAVESVALVIFSTQWNSRLLRNAAVLVALLATGWLIGNLGEPGQAAAWWKGAGIFSMLLFNAAWIGRKSDEGDRSEFRGLPSYYTLLGMFAWIAVVFALAPHAAVGWILAVTALALTAGHYLVRVREITLLSQGLLAIAQAQTFYLLLRSAPESAWGPLTVILGSVAMALWWKKQTVLDIDANSSVFVQVIASFAAAALVYAWLPQEVAGEKWIFTAIGLTVGWTVFGGFTRSWPLVAAGQLFLIGTATMTVHDVLNGRAPGWVAIGGLVATFVALAAAPRIAKRDHETLRIFTHFYQWTGALLAFLCVIAHVEASNRFLVLSVLMAASTGAAMFGARYAFAPGVALGLAGFFCWNPTWVANGAEVQHLLAILILAGTQFIARKNPERLPVVEAAHGAWIAAVSILLWIFVSRWVIVHSAGAHFYLTASWALLAFGFFIAGFGLRERSYRWAALAVLACALGRVVILDVWQLKTVYRIFSFLALGVVLLVLGYFYTRFQEKIARWL